MILKKFLGKTIEAAKKSAKQMYGNDFVVLDSNDTEGKSQITVAVDKNDSESEQDKDQQGSRKDSGVLFERSNNTPDQHDEQKKNVSSNLEKLRKYAENNEPSNGKNVQDDSRNETGEKNPFKKTAFSPTRKNGAPASKNKSLYSRASARPSAPSQPPQPAADSTAPQKEHTTADTSESAQETSHRPRSEKPDLLSRFDSAGPRINRTSNVPTSAPRREEREVTALHKRFDKLEALLDSSLISSNLDYASHPAFQQLVQTGISTSVVAGWFSSIIKDGIDPYDQNDMFMSKLSGIVREAIRCETDRKIQKYLLFAGPAGAGKTQLIMKLTQHPDFMKNKNIAVVSLLPQSAATTPYYTILRPFCEDHKIPFYGIKTGVNVTEMQEDWDRYDHVLIDSPSISTQQENSFRQYWKFRQILASLKPLEVHYVVNASLNKFYFKESSAINHPMQPDYIAITHLDEVSQWGPIIPFMKEMGCPARFVSNGDMLPESLHKFDPTWFAQNVLNN
jgi:flagellar biosynthesis GTPase FlhF